MAGFNFFGLRKAKAAAAGSPEEDDEAARKAEEDRQRKEEEERKRKERLSKGYFGEGAGRGRMMKQIQDDE